MPHPPFYIPHTKIIKNIYLLPDSHHLGHPSPNRRNGILNTTNWNGQNHTAKKTLTQYVSTTYDIHITDTHFDWSIQQFSKQKMLTLQIHYHVSRVNTNIHTSHSASSSRNGIFRPITILVQTAVSVYCIGLILKETIKQFQFSLF